MKVMEIRAREYNVNYNKYFYLARSPIQYYAFPSITIIIPLLANQVTGF